MISIIFNLCFFFSFIIIYIKNSLCNNTFSNNILIHRQLKISNYPGIFVVSYFQECDTASNHLIQVSFHFSSSHKASPVNKNDQGSKFGSIGLTVRDLYS